MEKIRQGLAFGVWGRPLGLGLTLPSSGLGLALPLLGRRWPFSKQRSALRVGVGPLGWGWPLVFLGRGWPFGWGWPGPDTKEEKARPDPKGEDGKAMGPDPEGEGQV